MLDPELGQLQYFVNEQGKSQKPRGSLPLIGASVTPSDEAPHMFVVNSVNGELYKLRGTSPAGLNVAKYKRGERVPMGTVTHLYACCNQPVAVIDPLERGRLAVAAGMSGRAVNYQPKQCLEVIRGPVRVLLVPRSSNVPVHLRLS